MFQLRSDCFSPSRTLRACGVVLLALWLHGANAAELGDVTVRSWIGQPLVADVELTGLADPAQPVQVRMASADIYRGANIAMPSVLSTLNMTTMRRDGRQFLHLTSTRNIDADYLLLFLELHEGARRNVRQVTVWLQADPHPAPPPMPAPVAMPAAVPPAVPPAAPAAMPEHAVAPTHAPAAPAPAHTAAHVAAAAVHKATPAACGQKYSAEQINTCAAIDSKNGLLSAQIVELEEKVKSLQVAVEGRGELPHPAVAVKAAAPVTLPQSVFKSARADKKKAGLPWLWIGIGGAALLTVVGGVLLLMKRKKRGAKAAPAQKVSALAGLKARFRRKPKAAKEVQVQVEPEAGVAA